MFERTARRCGKRRISLLASVATLALLAGVLAQQTVAKPTRSTATGKPDLAYVNAELAKYTAIPRFIPPGPRFDPSKARGKTVLNIPFSSAIPFVITIDKAMQSIAKRFGIKFIEFANQGSPVQWAAGIDQAVSQKVDLISLNGAPNPAVLQPQLARAKKAGIAITATHWNDISVAPPPNLTALIDPQYNKAGRLEADWVIKDTKGKANVLVITSSDIVPSNGIVAAIKDEFAKRCGSSCKTTVVNVPGNQWPKILGETQSALVKDPSINYVIPIYDSMSQFVVPAITAAGKLGRVHIATYNGTPFVMKMLADADVVRMEVGENLDWLGWATMDQIMRILTGTPPVKDEHTAIRVFTKANIKDAGTPPAENKGYGNAYVKGYNSLWVAAK